VAHTDALQHTESWCSNGLRVQGARSCGTRSTPRSSTLQSPKVILPPPHHVTSNSPQAARSLGILGHKLLASSNPQGDLHWIIPQIHTEPRLARFCSSLPAAGASHLLKCTLAVELTGFAHPLHKRHTAAINTLYKHSTLYHTFIIHRSRKFSNEHAQVSLTTRAHTLQPSWRIAKHSPNLATNQDHPTPANLRVHTSSTQQAKHTLAYANHTQTFHDIIGACFPYQ
jgi:hypothetical protein